MANEFKIKHGFVSTGDGTVEGEIRVSGAVYADNGSRVASRPWVTQFLTDNNYVVTGDLPTNISAFTNDSGYLTAVPSGYATETYVGTQISNLVSSAPSTLDTLNELAAALGDDPNFATTVTNSIATKLPFETYASGTDLNTISRTTFGAISTGNTSVNRNQNYSAVYSLGVAGIPNTLQLGTASDYDASGLWVRQYNQNGASPQGVGWQNWAKVWTDNDFANNSSNWNTAYGWGNHAGLYDAAGTGAAEAGAVNTRIDDEIIPLIDTKQPAGDYLTSLPAHNHNDLYYTETEVNTFLSGKLSTSGGTVTGNLNISKDNPILILNETNAANNTEQVAYISFQDNGTEEAWIGWGSQNNTDFTFRNNIGNVVLNATTTAITGDLQIPAHIFHTGDTDTYMQFHADNQWRVVTGGTERLEVNDSATTVANLLTASGGINGLTLANGGISGGNYNITGVNQLEIADPGEGIVFKAGTSGDITLAIVDDAADNILNLGGTNASFTINGATVATQSYAEAAAQAVNERIDTEVLPSIPTNNNQLTNGAGYITDGNTNWNNTYGFITASDSITGNASSATKVVTIQDTPPTGVDGKLWWESDTGKLKVYYGTSSAWIDALPVIDTTNFYTTSGGGITGDVYIGQTLTVAGNITGEALINGVDIAAFKSAYDSKVSNWDTAYGWGNHASAGYLTTVPSEYLTQTEGDARYLQSLPSHNHDTLYDALGSAAAVEVALNTRIEEEVLTSIPTNNNQLTNGAGYITDGNTGWNNSYGFITASSTDTLTNKSGNISQWTNDSGYITDGNTGWNNTYGFITGLNWTDLGGDPADINVSQFTNDAGYITDGNTNWNNSYGFITASDSITGNAATATKLATARNIALAGDVTGSANFDGSANITITAAVANDSHTHDGRYYTESESDARFVNVTGDNVTGDLSVSGASLSVTSTAEGSEAFFVDGVNGRLFTVTDSLSDSLFSVNTISGLPVIEAFSDNTVKLGPFNNPVTIDSTGVLAIGGETAATQSYVTTSISNLVGGAPGALNTLNELAAAINDDASFASSVTTSLSLKAPLASPALTGTPTAPTAATSTNSTQIATTAYVKAQGYVTTDTNYYLNGITRSGNVLTFSVNGATNQTYTFGSAAWAATTAFDAAGTGAAEAAAVNNRIDNEVLPAVAAITLSSLGYTGATNANYITNNNQLTNGAGYITSADGGNAQTLDGVDSSQFVRSDQNSVTIARHLDANTTWTSGLYTLFLGWNSGKTIIGNNADAGHDYASALGGNSIPILNKSYFFKTAKFEEDIQIDGNVNFLAGVGTWVTSDAMSDSIGWNTNHGVYIGSNVGGTHYLRGNGKFTTGGATYNLWHEGNFDPATKETAGAADAVNQRIDNEVLPAIPTVPTNVSAFTNDAGYITDGNTNWNNSYGFITASSNITGNAATATAFSTGRTNYKDVTDGSVVGQLMWKNYGNNHTIFDASNSTTPGGTACSNSTPEVPWTNTYPTLMGWNGSSTYGVRVDSAGLSDNSLALGGLSVHSGTNNQANKIVRTDGNGYLNAGWINTISGDRGVVAPTRIYASNDSYVRYYTPANFISVLGLVTTSNSSSQSVVTIQDAAPGGAAGKLWWESDTGKLKVYYDSAWVDASPVPDVSIYYPKSGGGIAGDVIVEGTLTVVGNTLVEGTFTETSDINLKENIAPLENSLDKVMNLNGVSFNKKETPGISEIGFIAQQVEKIVPELVTETESGIKTVSYTRVSALLVETVKEQQNEIESLKALVAELAEKINNL